MAPIVTAISEKFLTGRCRCPFILKKIENFARQTVICYEFPDRILALMYRFNKQLQLRASSAWSLCPSQPGRNSPYQTGSKNGIQLMDPALPTVVTDKKVAIDRKSCTFCRL
jgi:hypothetical protein